MHNIAEILTSGTKALSIVARSSPSSLILATHKSYQFSEYIQCPCLVPRPHFSSRPKRFRSRGPCENVSRPFASDTSPKRIGREGRGKRCKGTRQTMSYKRATEEVPLNLMIITMNVHLKTQKHG